MNSARAVRTRPASGASRERLDAAGDPRNLLQPVADINKTYPLLAELINLRKEPVSFPAAEGRSGLIQNQEPGFESERLRDLNLLLSGDP